MEGTWRDQRDGLPGFGRPLRRVGVGVLAATTAASACLGAVVLIARGLSVSAVATASPVWGHPVLAGITLGVVVGAPSIWLAWLTCSGDTRTDAIALLSGALVIGWTATEIAMVREFGVIQPTYLAGGAVLIWLGRTGTGSPPDLTPGRSR